MMLPDFLKLRILNTLPQARVVTPDDLLLPPVDLAPSALKADWQHWRGEDVQVLRERGLVVVDGVVGQPVACGARDEIAAFAEAGRLKRAGMKSDSETWLDATYRGDLHMWISNIALDDEQHRATMPHIVTLLRKLHDMAAELRSACPAFEHAHTQTQITLYPAGGSHYVRHMDASKGRAEARLLTFVYYANPDWIPAHGGQLRAYLDGGPLTVEPVADRLVVFQSRLIEHEVLEAFANRYAVSSWFCI